MSRSSPSFCSSCGALFVPWIKSDRQPVKVCLPCGMLNLASHCEHVEEGDSLADISDGEQNGAFFRMIARLRDYIDHAQRTLQAALSASENQEAH